MSNGKLVCLSGHATASRSGHVGYPTTTGWEEDAFATAMRDRGYSKTKVALDGVSADNGPSKMLEASGDVGSSARPDSTLWQVMGCPCQNVMSLWIGA